MNLLPQHAPLYAVTYSPRFTADGRLFAESSRVGRVIAWTNIDDSDPRLIPVVAADGRTSAGPAAGEDTVEVFDTRALAEARARELAPKRSTRPVPEPGSATEKEDQQRRVYALGGLLQAIRSQRGWSVEVAAVHAGIGHMSWRRAEQGGTARLRTYGALDRLLELPPGTVNRATRSDEELVVLAEHVGVDVSDARNMAAHEWVAKLAEGAAVGTPAGRVVHRAELEQ